jgi:hypothetical protein
MLEASLEIGLKSPTHLLASLRIHRCFFQATLTASEKRWAT